MDSASGGPNVRSVDTEWGSSPQVSTDKRDVDEAVGSSADWPVIANGGTNTSTSYGSTVVSTSSIAMEPVDRFVGPSLSRTKWQNLFNRSSIYC